MRQVSVVESAVCVAQGQNAEFLSKGRLKDPRSGVEPRRGKDCATVEVFLWSSELRVIVRIRTVCER